MLDGTLLILAVLLFLVVIIWRILDSLEVGLLILREVPSVRLLFALLDWVVQTVLLFDMLGIYFDVPG